MQDNPDWMNVIAEHTGSNAAEFDLATLLPDDRLIVSTAHTHYAFTIISGREADLETNRPDRPSGRVRLCGCTMGGSSSIKPDHLFCGGNLEFIFERDGQRRTQLTTAITALRHLRKKE